MSCYIDFAAGDEAAYLEATAQYESLRDWLSAHAASYGLAPSLASLDAAGQETLLSVYASTTKIALSPSSLLQPSPLTLPRLHLTLSPSPGLSKTTKNFVDLLTDSRMLVSKRSPHSKLRYEGSRVHRVEPGFCVQGGDVTRGDGSGGESIYGPTFNDEKEGLKTAFQFGTIAMANSGKNTNSSQWFLTLATTAAQLKKLSGKYVAFGQADLAREATRECLLQLGQLGDGKGGTRCPVWIAKCGVEE